MSSFRDDLEARLSADPGLRAEYDALGPEYAAIQALVDARAQAGMTLEDLAAATGIRAGNISRIESGRGNPTLRTLQRLAAGMGKTLEVRYV